ncbi:MAG: class I SAM-dependent methyltransferase [Candidatus Dormiibacterota bacterium]
MFGEVADLYDRYRPTYPEVVFDRMVEFGHLGSGDRVLEVGAGTGRATRPLALRGLAVTALEPSPAMARLARQNTRDMGAVRVEEASFEDWPLPPDRFRLVASAQAWHWVRAEVAYARARDALEPGGTLALVWNTVTGEENRSGIGSQLEAEIEQVYRREAPRLAHGVPSEREPDRQHLIQASGAFGEVVREDYPWSTAYTSEEYLGLLRTQSDHRLLDPTVLERLLNGIGLVLAGHGGRIDQSYVARLYLARRPQ